MGYVFMENISGNLLIIYDSIWSNEIIALCCNVGYLWAWDELKLTFDNPQNAIT